MATTAESLLMLGFIALAVSLTIAAFAIKSGRSILAIAGCGAWVLLGVYSYTHYTIEWDVLYALFFLSMGMAIATALIAVILREKTEIEPTISDLDSEDQELIDEMEDEERTQEAYDRLLGSKRTKRGPLRKRQSQLKNYVATGK